MLYFEKLFFFRNKMQISGGILNKEAKIIPWTCYAGSMFTKITTIVIPAYLSGFLIVSNERVVNKFETQCRVM